jgi:hypothetical protein
MNAYVSFWQERDRMHIEVVDNETDQTIAEWWDDDARQMFEDGFFVAGRGFKDSVFEYCRSMGLI